MTHPTGKKGFLCKPRHYKAVSSCRHRRFSTSAQALFQMLSNNQWKLSNWKNSKR